MTAPTPPNPERNETSGVPPDEILELLRLFGQILNSTNLYGWNHKITQQAMDEGFARITRLLADRADLAFSIVEGSLLIDGRLLEVRNPFATVFIRKLTAHAIEQFALTRGITREELGKLLEIVAASPDKLRLQGGFADLLARYGLNHISAGATSFQRISTDQVVLKKTNLTQEGNGPGGSDKTKSVEQIVAFLKGDVAGDKTKSGKEGDNSQTDAQQLADLIMKSAEVAPQTAAVDGGESLIDLVVGSLRRQADKLLESPAGRTQAGKKNLAKMFMLLEKNILDRLRSMADMSDIDLVPVVDAFEEIRTDLTADTLAAEYMKKRGAMAGAEEKILKYIQRNNAKNSATCDVLKDKLLESGLSMEGWQELRVRSSETLAGVGGPGVKGAPDGSSGQEGKNAGGMGGPGSGLEIQGIASLAMLLSELDSLLTPNQGRADEGEVQTQIATVAAKINSEVEGLVARTETKMQHLVDTSLQILEEEKKWDKVIAQKAKLSRRALMALLAEIVQELCQPLSVVSCTLDMTITRRLGDINEEQAEMLKLSMSSCLRLQKLVEKLRDVCGNPETLTPDSRILDYVYS